MRVRPYGRSAQVAWDLTLLTAVMLCAALGNARAQDDPPGRAAQLSYAEGAVALQPAGVQDWTAATLNRPLTTGDRLWSDQHSRAELDLGTAAVRLGSNTAFGFLNLDDHSVQMQLSTGTIVVALRDLQGGESYEVDTPNVALALQQPGVYRIEVNDQGTATAAAVSCGAAQAIGAGGQTISIGAQQVAIFKGVETLAWQSNTLGAPDEFDAWSAQRERERADSASRGNVANDVPGTQDLDDYGYWQQAPEYGYVWVPTAVAVGWAPYRYGHWLWVTPWGWTWVDDARWGYAPFHYGRWAVWNHGWVWVPAPRRAGPAGRSVYAPALVAWVGGASASVGWFPLGPREVYVPGYPASQNYVRNVNITNTTRVTNTDITNVQYNLSSQHYMNDTAAAVTSVPRTAFTSGQRIGGHFIPLSSAMLVTAGVAAAALAIAPLHQSVLGPGEVHVPRPPAALLQRTVVARTAPPAVPVVFERQQAAIERNGGKPLARSELAALQPAAPLAPVKVVASGGGRVPAPANQGFAEREYDAAHVVDRPSSVPVYHFPSAADVPTHPATAAHPQQPPRSAPPQPAPPAATAAPPPPAAHSSAPAHAQPSNEPRDSAPHGDRDSRERVLR